MRNEDRGKPPKKFENWDQKGVIYYELLKPGETVNTNRYQQQMIDLNRALQEKWPDYRRRQHKVIFLHDNAPSHTAKRVKETIETFSWEILANAEANAVRIDKDRITSHRLSLSLSPSLQTDVATYIAKIHNSDGRVGEEKIDWLGIKRIYRSFRR